MLMRFKPVYNFQSVEFEAEINSPEDLEKAFNSYKICLEKLQQIAPEQPAQPKSAPKEAMASDKQKALLIKLGLNEYEVNKMTAKQAYMKIKELTE